ncbi:MAG: hypothetical protein HY856_15620 [Burkholderiales bacterium]|nr:hypothetical protein [Burkholderiales bacterium]
MLISYPFLPASAIHDDEDIYLARIVEGHLLQYEGVYPVSTMPTPQGDVHRWHGGVHLHGGGEPVRAIADGTVVAYRFAAEAETYGSLGRYDTSFVLLRHETQTGENTTVAFYSLYMHLANQADLTADRLSQLPRWMRGKPGSDVHRPAEQRVWRKDVLGFAGQLYNREAMHFEVFMLDEDLNRVWRDSKAITQGAGSNDWFGDAHFVIPEDQPFAERHPRAPAKGPHRVEISGATDFPLPLGQAGRNAEKLYVSVTLHRGRRVARTYRASKDGGYEQVGTAVVQDKYEYELYHLATALYPDCPSAGLEWLRFGRVLGPDRTTRNENWQLVRYSESAIGYIDLAPEAIAKLSDADFPHWQGWQKRDEGTTAHASDGICDDAPTLTLVQAARGSSDAARALQHLICKAPSEWDDEDLAARYARMRAPGQPLEAEDNWNRFKDHVAKMAFWKAAGMKQRSVWHFHPLRFIRRHRKCAWLSTTEFRQLRPSHAVRTGSKDKRPTVFWEAVAPWSEDNAAAVPNRYRVPLNNMMRKYGINTGTRQAAFFGNAIQETTWLSRLSEGSGGTLWYAPWYGRGFLQLTNPENYIGYWAWRGRVVPAKLATELVHAYKAIADKTPASRSNATLQDAHFKDLTEQVQDWRDDVAGSSAPDATAEEKLAPADSAGFYWVMCRMAGHADLDHVMERHEVSTTLGVKVYYRSPAFWRASAAVNLPSVIDRLYSSALNGFDSRCCAYGVAMVVLTDARLPNAQGASTVWFPEGYTPARA